MPALHDVLVPSVEDPSELLLIRVSPVGALVRRDDVVAEIETHKAVLELTAPVDGVVRTVAGAGSVVPGQVIVTIEEATLPAHAEHGRMGEAPPPRTASPMDTSVAERVSVTVAEVSRAIDIDAFEKHAASLRPTAAPEETAARCEAAVVLHALATALSHASLGMEHGPAGWLVSLTEIEGAHVQSWTARVLPSDRAADVLASLEAGEPPRTALAAAVAVRYRGSGPERLALLWSRGVRISLALCAPRDVAVVAGGQLVTSRRAEVTVAFGGRASSQDASTILGKITDTLTPR